MGQRTPTTDDSTDTDDDGLMPEDIPRMRPVEDTVVEEAEDMKSIFEQLLTPRSRAAILDALVDARGEALTVSQMVNRNPKINPSGFRRHQDDLEAFGVMEEAGKVGNAMTYRLNVDHPAAQLLAMLDNVMQWGYTPMMLDEKFVREEFPGDGQ